MNAPPPAPRILSIVPSPRLDYLVGGRRFPVIGLALVQYPGDEAPCVEPLYLGEHDCVQAGASHYGYGDVVLRGAPTFEEREAAAAQRKAAQEAAALERQDRKQDNRERVLRALREAPAGMAKRHLLAMLRGRADIRRRVLTSLNVDGLTVEYRQGCAIYVALRPHDPVGGDTPANFSIPHTPPTLR